MCSVLLNATLIIFLILKLKFSIVYHKVGDLSIILSIVGGLIFLSNVYYFKKRFLYLISTALVIPFATFNFLYGIIERFVS